MVANIHIVPSGFIFHLNHALAIFFVAFKLSKQTQSKQNTLNRLVPWTVAPMRRDVCSPFLLEWRSNLCLFNFPTHSREAGCQLSLLSGCWVFFWGVGLFFIVNWQCIRNILKANYIFIELYSLYSWLQNFFLIPKWWCFQAGYLHVCKYLSNLKVLGKLHHCAWAVLF